MRRPRLAWVGVSLDPGRAHVKYLASSALLALASAAFAQPTQVSLSWQFSVDDGTTWSPGAVTIDGTQPTFVRVQGVLTWHSSPPTIDVFAALSFDPYVDRAPGTGGSDWILDPVFRRDRRFQPFIGSSVTSLGTIIKVDRDTDVLPPGEGTGWIVPGQSYAFGEFDSRNPLVISDYTYSLDGTSGIRTVSAALWHNASGMSPWFYDFDIDTNVHFAAASVIPGTITVIPAPAGSLALLSLGTALVRRRR